MPSSGHWVDTRLPPALRPFARLARWERPIGWWLLLWPCWWSAALAAIAAGNGWPNPVHLVLFFIGAVAMRGAGCTYNDIVDVDIDAQVERTRSRPIPAGQVTRFQAKAFLVIQALVGLAVLLQFNSFCHRAGHRLAAAGRHLSLHEAHHQLAAAFPRSGVLLGRLDGLGGGLR